MNVKSRACSSFMRVLLLLPLLLWLPASARAIPCLTGFVRDGQGNPVADGDLDFNISATGQRIITPGDNTDADGFYSVCVLPNTYDVGFAPPAGTRLLGKLVRGVDLTGEAGLELDVVLDEGMIAAGLVTDSAGLPVPDVDIDVDRIEGGRLYTPGDNTAADGNFAVVVPSGMHRFRFEPPRGSRLRGAEIDSVDVSADISLDVLLEEGMLLGGRVSDQAGSAAVDVEVDLRDAVTGAKIYLANNATDQDGNYTVAVPAGVFQLRFTPSRDDSLVAVAVSGVSLDSDATIDQTLAPGHRLTVEVLGLGGLPLADADLDVKDAVSGAKLFTPHDRTDGAGRALAVLPTGTFNLIVDPPAGASYAGALVPAVTVSGDTTITVHLDGAPRVTVSGRVVDDQGTGQGEIAFGATLSETGEDIRLASDHTGTDGRFAIDLPPLPVDLTLTPAPGSRLVARRLTARLARQDTTWSDIVLTRGELVTVNVAGTSGLPLAGADLDFTDIVSGQEIFTPRDNTDSQGRAVVALPPGIYRLVVTPVDGSGFSPTTVENLDVQADTELAVTLSVAVAGGRPVAVAAAWPNPFRETAAVDFLLQDPAPVEMAVYDLRGRLVRRISAGPHAEGAHTLIWDGRTGGGGRAAAGTYLIMLKTARGSDTRRITLVR